MFFFFITCLGAENEINILTIAHLLSQAFDESEESAEGPATLGSRKPIDIGTKTTTGNERFLPREVIARVIQSAPENRRDTVTLSPTGQLVSQKSVSCILKGLSGVEVYTELIQFPTPLIPELPGPSN